MFETRCLSYVENLNSPALRHNKQQGHGTRSSAWIEHRTSNPMVAGSNPAGSANYMMIDRETRNIGI